MVKLSDIKHYEKNAKKHPKKQVQAIAESINAFGFLVPGVITQDGELIAGHGRHMAAMELELEAMPCIRAEHLSEEAIKAYRLADNKLAESDWDMDLVVAELKDLSLTARSDGTRNGVDDEARQGLRVRASDAKAGRAYYLRNREQLQGWRHRAGSIQWLRLDPHRGGENGTNILRRGIRPDLCRRDCAKVRRLYCR